MTKLNPDLTPFWDKMKDPGSTAIGLLASYCIITGTSPEQLLEKFLLMPTDQYIRLLSGIALGFVCYFAFQKQPKKIEYVMPEDVNDGDK